MMHVTDRRRLGKSGVEVPVIGFGGAPLGNLFQQFSDEQARATVRAAYDAGMRLFDTAPLYGHGLSEHRIGEALRWLDRGQLRAVDQGRPPAQPARPEHGRWQAVQAGPAVRGRLRLFLRCRDALGRRQPAASRHAPDRRAADPRRRRLDPRQRGGPAGAVQGGDGRRLPRAAQAARARAWSAPSAPGSTRSRPARTSPAPATSTASCWPAATRCWSRRPGHAAALLRREGHLAADRRPLQHRHPRHRRRRRAPTTTTPRRRPRSWTGWRGSRPSAPATACGWPVPRCSSRSAIPNVATLIPGPARPTRSRPNRAIFEVAIPAAFGPS